MRIASILILTLATASAHGQTGRMNGGDLEIPKLDRMPESLEIQYALSALPPLLRQNATTYALDPGKGYVLHHQGTNGLTCIVVRSDWQFPTRPFRDDIYWPVCYDSEGSKTLLQDYLYAAELRARNMNSGQVHAAVTKRFKDPAYPNPGRNGVSYMLAPVMRGFTHGIEPTTMNMPHYMFYAPNVRNSDIGGTGFGPYPFVLSMGPGRDDVIIMLVGETEKASILRESENLLADLCAYRNYLCTTASTRARTPVN